MKKYSVIMLFVALFCSVGSAGVIGDLIEISKAPFCQSFTQAVYNPIEDEYLVVWEDNRTYQTTHSDIYGQIIRGDGTLRGENICVTNDSSSQWWPHLDFDPISNRYLIVFSDNRNAQDIDDWYDNYDVYAAILDKDGKHIETEFTEIDTCFSICTDSSAIHYPDVAYNSMTGTFLVVWTDYRGVIEYNGDIYGQIVNANGEFLIPSDRSENFVICDTNNIHDVPVVTYSDYINEWFVVFGSDNYMNNIEVWGQRVSAYGALRDAIGHDQEGPMVIATDTGNYIDPLQPRAQFNYEYDNSLNKPAQSSKFCECLVTWVNGAYPDNDIYGQRVAFVPDSEAVKMGLKPTADDDSLFFCYAINNLGDFEVHSAFPISDATGLQNAPDIAWSEYDNEFMLHWEDQRNMNTDYYNTDEYGQRVYVEPDSSVSLITLDRANDVASTENCEIDTDEYKSAGGNLVGIAHNSYRNEFLVAYAVYDSTNEENGNELVARIIKGTIPVGVEENESVPAAFSLGQNYPNPFNPQTTIEYNLDKAGDVQVVVYDINGKRIQTLYEGYRQAGNYQLTWNGMNAQNQQVASGVYFYKMQCNGNTLVRKMTLIR